jgi:ubiquinone/menaquinone biosynthesis C-methylase UbiE
MVIEMEIREIVKHLSEGDRILDVGCANGFSTIHLASQLKTHVRGIDYIPEMIEQARLRVSRLATGLLGTVEFAQGDVTHGSRGACRGLRQGGGHPGHD